MLRSYTCNLGLVFLCLSTGIACSGNSGSSEPGLGGSSSAMGGSVGTGGSSIISGGASSTGGTVSAGGTRVASGGTNTDGTLAASGGSVATGGTNTGGTLAASGGSVATGGTSSAGGTTAIGGSKAIGGTPTTGGTNASGGATGGGGATTAAGAKATGGNTATGGKATGGKAATGGTGGGYGGGAALGGRPQITPAPGATLVKVDPSLRYQHFEGWGSSLCWWAYRIGGWSTAKKNQFLDLIVDPTAGLGYNIFRYNIGGGENPAHQHMGANREMPGFEPTSGTWAWDADSRQTSVLSRLVASGQNVILEAFSNSPPYWMTKSGCASGNTDGSNNLKDDSYDLFAGYLTDVVKHYHDTLGITFRTLEPMNEPNSSWWKANGSQEGCHFGATSQQQIIKAVGAQLVTKGLTDTGVSASDENSMDNAYSIMSGYDAATMGYMVQMNTHSYNGTRRAELRTLATSNGKRLWQSESGPLSATLNTEIDAAVFMAGRIITDLRDLKPEAWIDWQIVDPSMPWSTFSVSDSAETWTPFKRFYMHAGFSRFIRPGATFIDINNVDMVAALASDGSVLTVVARNGDAAATRSFTFDLTGLPSIGSSINVYRTSASENLAHLPAIAVQNWSFTASVTPYSVTTYVIPLGQP